jgi:transposase-like protein
MKTVKEVAAEIGITTQAIYKLLKTHQKELSPYVHQQGKTRFFDDEGIEKLRNFSIRKTVAIIDTTTQEKIADLELENKQLLQQLAEARQQTIIVQQQLAGVQQQLIEAAIPKKSFWKKIFK